MNTVATHPTTRKVGFAFRALEDELQPSLALRLLDEIDYGLVLVSSRGRVLHANHLARHELAMGRLVFTGDEGTIACPDTEQTEQLLAAIEGAVHGRRRLLYLTHEEHRLPVAAIPLNHALASPTSSVLLAMARQRVGDNLTLQMFALEHNLTPTEESVLRALCDGDEVDEIAARHGVAESTVRTQVRALRDKTGARGIRQLVQRVLSLPPVVPALRAGGFVGPRPSSSTYHFV
ncbi:MAG: LuxR C-terminal-related transcriptional regulator [Proteobacteria bacterium]|nr:LuxR C-terminal-related transcriptional regulator [Pseudomonadota bacterium]